MSLSEDTQKRLWILAQPIINSDDNFSNLISKMYLICQVFNNNVPDTSDVFELEIKEDIESITEDLKKHRTHQIVRTQDNINEFRIKIHDNLSKIITLIDPEIMQEIPIQEMN